MLEMLLFLLAAAAESCVGIEHKKYPRLTQKGSADVHFRFAGFKIEDFAVSLTKKPAPGCVYGVHDLLEAAPLEPIAHQNVIAKEGGKLLLRGFETEITPVALLSCYYDGLLRQENVDRGSPVFVATRDYYTWEEYGVLFKAMKNIGVRKTTVLPESTCAAASLAGHLAAGEKKSVYIVNFQGSQVVGSLFELECVVDDAKTSKKVKYILSSPLEAIPDDEIERTVVAALRSCLAANEGTPKQASLLPYEEQTEWYADISAFFSLVSSNLGYRNVDTYLHKEQEFHRKGSNDVAYAIGISVDVGELRKAILDKIKISIPAAENAQAYFLSYWPLRESATDCEGGIRPINSSAILKGAAKLGRSDFAFTDPRAVDSVSQEDESYKEFVSELTYKARARTVPADFESARSNLTYLEEADFEEITALLKQEEKGKEGIAGDYSLENAKRLVDAFDSLVKLNAFRRSNAAILQNSRDELMRTVKKYSAYEGELLRKELAVALEKAQALLDDKESILTAKDYDDQVIKLVGIYGRISQHLREEEEQRRRAEAEARAEDEKKTAEAAESGDANAGTADRAGSVEDGVGDVANKEHSADAEDEAGSDENSVDGENIAEAFEKFIPKDGDVGHDSYNKFIEMLRKNMRKMKKNKGGKENAVKDNVDLEEKTAADEQATEAEKAVL